MFELATMLLPADQDQSDDSRSLLHVLSPAKLQRLCQSPIAAKLQIPSRDLPLDYVISIPFTLMLPPKISPKNKSCSDTLLFSSPRPANNVVNTRQVLFYNGFQYQRLDIQSTDGENNGEAGIVDASEFSAFIEDSVHDSSLDDRQACLPNQESPGNENFPSPPRDALTDSDGLNTIAELSSCRSIKSNIVNHPLRSLPSLRIKGTGRLNKLLQPTRHIRPNTCNDETLSTRMIFSHPVTPKSCQHPPSCIHRLLETLNSCPDPKNTTSTLPTIASSFESQESPKSLLSNSSNDSVQSSIELNLFTLRSPTAKNFGEKGNLMKPSPHSRTNSIELISGQFHTPDKSSSFRGLSAAPSKMSIGNSLIFSSNTLIENSRDLARSTFIQPSLDLSSSKFNQELAQDLPAINIPTSSPGSSKVPLSFESIQPLLSSNSPRAFDNEGMGQSFSFPNTEANVTNFCGDEIPVPHHAIKKKSFVLPNGQIEIPDCSTHPWIDTATNYPSGIRRKAHHEKSKSIPNITSTLRLPTSNMRFAPRHQRHNSMHNISYCKENEELVTDDDLFEFGSSSACGYMNDIPCNGKNIAEPPVRVKYPIDFKEAPLSTKHNISRLAHEFGASSLQSHIPRPPPTHGSIDMRRNSNSSSLHSSHFSARPYESSISDTANVIIDLTKDTYNVCTVNRSDSLLSYKSLSERTRNGKLVEVVLVDEEVDELSRIYSRYRSDWAQCQSSKNSCVRDYETRHEHKSNTTRM